MTTSPTDTPKRLSDENVRSYRAQASASIDGNGSLTIRGAAPIIVLLCDHIAALTAPPSQGKVERARELLAQKYEEIYASQGEKPASIRGGGNPSIPANAAIAAITQALTESSGQTDPEAVAILRTLGCVPDSTDLSETDAKVSVGFLRRLIESSGQGTDGAPYELIEECVEIIRWRETGLLQQGGYLQARAEKLSHIPDNVRLRLAEENVCMDAMRFVASTLPLPVSADGKYVTVLRQELLDLLLFVGQMDAEDAEMGQDFFDLIARLKEIATPQPKQPDTGAGK